MKVVRLLDGVHVIRGLVNIYVLETLDGIALVDTGFPGSERKIGEAFRRLGLRLQDLRHIVLTHCHPDHMGSAAALKRETGATVWAHPIDALAIEAGKPVRSGAKASPGLRNRILTAMLKATVPKVEPVHVDRLIEDGDALPFLGRSRVYHVPGHCAGQIAILCERDGGILFPADAIVNRRGPTLPAAVEDLPLALASVERLRTLEFEVTCFMHGPPTLTNGAVTLRLAAFPL